MYAEILLAVIGAVGAYLSYMAKKHAKEANRAVNSNKDPHAKRLYDIVLSMDERTGRLENWMIKHKGETVERDIKLDDIEARLTAKIIEYGCPVKLGEDPLCGDKDD